MAMDRENNWTQLTVKHVMSAANINTIDAVTTFPDYLVQLGLIQSGSIHM